MDYSFVSHTNSCFVRSGVEVGKPKHRTQDWRTLLLSPCVDYDWDWNSTYLAVGREPNASQCLEVILCGSECIISLSLSMTYVPGCCEH